MDAGKAWAVIGSETGGRCETRTHGAVAGTPVFKTGALDHSANLPASRRFWSRHNVGFAELVSPGEARFARVPSRPVHQTTLPTFPLPAGFGPGHAALASGLENNNI